MLTGGTCVSRGGAGCALLYGHAHWYSKMRHNEFFRLCVCIGVGGYDMDKVVLGFKDSFRWGVLWETTVQEGMVVRARWSGYDCWGMVVRI